MAGIQPVKDPARDVGGEKTAAKNAAKLASAKTGSELAILWPKLPYLTPEEAAAFGDEIEAARNSLPPLVDKWTAGPFNESR